jgi:hypothetical protein
MQSNATVGVIMSQRHQGRGTLNLNVQLFLQLSIKGLPGRLPRFQFAAGELPQSTLVQMIRSLRDQYLAGFVEDNPGCNVHYIRVAVVHQSVRKTSEEIRLRSDIRH